MLASPVSDLLNGFGGVAEIAEISEVADGLGVQAQELAEQDGVELDDVELALAGGKVGELFGDGVGLGGEEVVAVSGDGEEGGAGGLRSRADCAALAVSVSSGSSVTL